MRKTARRSRRARRNRRSRVARGPSRRPSMSPIKLVSLPVTVLKENSQSFTTNSAPVNRKNQKGCYEIVKKKMLRLPPPKTFVPETASLKIK